MISKWKKDFPRYFLAKSLNPLQVEYTLKQCIRKIFLYFFKQRKKKRIYITNVKTPLCGHEVYHNERKFEIYVCT